VPGGRRTEFTYLVDQEDSIDRSHRLYSPSGSAPEHGWAMSATACNRAGGPQVTDLRSRPARPVASCGGRPSHPAALHVLTNSLPHTRSGYAYRSHAILTTLQDAGHRVAAVTRPSYPVTIGRVSSGPVETVDGSRLPATDPAAAVADTRRLGWAIRRVGSLPERSGA
jgi:hypothetical protein